jgi:hypothetical protein
VSASDNYGALQCVVEDVRTGPISEMRAAGRLTPSDLRAGAARAEEDARCRRILADRMEAGALADISVTGAKEWLNLISREAPNA